MSASHAPPTPAKRGRRPNPERKAASRGRLLDAALASLSELGFAATTTTEVVARSGLSRGALFSHFPTRQGLMVAVAERALNELGELYDAAFAEAILSSDEPHAVIAIEAIHRVSQAPAMRVVTLLYAEATTSPALRDVLRPLAETNFEALLHRAQVVLPDLADSDATFQAFLVMWFSLLGMAAQKPIYLNPRAERAVLAALTAYARSTLTATHSTN